jgi:hypothetical protein
VWKSSGHGSALANAPKSTSSAKFMMNKGSDSKGYKNDGT